MSDLVRECISLGLKLADREPELMAGLSDELFADEMKAILASGYTNPKAMRLLKQIANEVHTEPDFG
jgi:hypothetical protein